MRRKKEKRGLIVKNPTKRQLEILRFLRDYIKEHEFPPTYKEVQDHFKFASKQAVSRHFENMTKKGLIFRIVGSPRAIRITPKGKELFQS